MRLLTAGLVLVPWLITPVATAGEVKELATFQGLGPVVSVAFSPDGKTFVAGTLLSLHGAPYRGQVRVWDVRTGEERHTGPWLVEQSVFEAVFTPDSKLLAVGTGDEQAGGEVWLWDLNRDERRARRKGHPASVTSLAITADGHTLAAANSLDKGKAGEVKLWDLGTCKERLAFQEKSGLISSLAFTPDGKVLVLGSADKGVKLLDVATGKLLAVFKGHTDRVTSVAISPDGKTLASGSRDKTVRLWEMATGKTRHTLRGADHVFSVAFSPDGNWLASGSGTFKAGEVKLWDVSSGHELATVEGHRAFVLSLAFKANGRILASGCMDGAVRLWDLTPLQDKKPKDKP
jgi:WD40 repeat protein